jgi:D-alanyl-lipoteichoic acid acyltransferase DltB (MBOAT superfamily)
MLFNSLAFAVFLPVVFLLYWFVFGRNVKGQNLFIVAASYFFYGWCDWRFLLLIAFTSLCSYASGILIHKYRNVSRKAKLFSVLNIVVNLLVLGAFKYYDFFATSFANVFLRGRVDGLLLHLALPIGISFYTFKALSYSIDVYRGKLEPTRDVVQFFAFVGFFPELLAGPIDRAASLLPQFAKPRSFDYETGIDGLRQFLWGLFKKIAVADTCAVYVDQVLSPGMSPSGSTVLLASILYSFQIYGDFSGYSDMAIGTGKLFGIKLMRNFAFPYFSRDVAEFWRRWHISLTTWFRDYVYIPLGGSRCSKGKIVRNTFVIFLLSGLWHGANWTFIAWGAYHALLFLPMILLGKNRKYQDVVAQDRFLPSWKEFWQMLSVFFLVTVGWILFRADDIAQGWTWLRTLCSRSLFSVPASLTSRTFVPIAVYLTMLVVIEWFQRQQEHALKPFAGKRVANTLFYLAVLVAVFAAAVSAQGDRAFIYFQF